MEKQRNLVLWLSLIMTFVLGSVIIPQLLRAEEIRYPIPCYEGEELARVRTWEKTLVGQKITPANIDEVKDLLPGPLYDLLNTPEKWGEYWFEIVPYREMEHTEGEIRYTKEGRCSIGPDEGLVNYVSGFPFPTPQTGLEVAYNFDSVHWGDNFIDHTLMQIADGRRKYNRHVGVDEYQTYFTGRRDVPPEPAFDPNPNDQYHAYHAAYFEPPALKGTRALTIKWNDRTRDYGSWEFSSSTRRVLRRSTAQRQTHIGPSDFTYDDQAGYNWVINAQTYKLVGRKELLMPRNQDPEQLEQNDVEGFCYVSGHQRERINTYELECINKDPNYIYSKQIWYVDPESWTLLYALKYDRQGKLWKLSDLATQTIKSTYKGIPALRIANQTIIDVQRMHGTKAYFQKWIAGERGLNLDMEYFTPQALQRYGY